MLPGGGATRIVSASCTVCEAEPRAPVMVIVEVPVAALPLTAKLITLVDEVEVVLNDAVTPAGTPEAERFTLPDKPASLTLRIELAAAPCWIASAAGRAEMENPLIVSLIAVVAVRGEDVPLIVMVAVPAAALFAAVKLRVLCVFVLAGLKVAFTPAGRPDTDRLTAFENPFAGTTEIVTDP